MHCPKCKAYTATENLLDVEVDVCPTCQGIWFDRNELSRIVGTTQDISVTGASMKETPYRCPRCHQTLMEVPYTWDKTMKVDMCASCEGIFLDAGELEKASAAVQAYQEKFPQGRIDNLRKRNALREALTTAYGTEAPASKAMGAERVAFMKKVYSLLTATLGLTVGGIVFGRATGLWQLWPLWSIGSFIVFLILIFGVRRIPTVNLVFLAIYTFMSGLGLSGIVEAFVQAGAGILVLQAFLITLGVFGALTGYIFVTKKDLSGWGPWLFVMLLVLVLSGIVMIFFSTPMADFIWSVLGALLFCGFILYDTSRIMLKYGTDEYVSACIDLYLDFINLFLDILRILARLRS